MWDRFSIWLDNYLDTHSIADLVHDVSPVLLAIVVLVIGWRVIRWWRQRHIQRR